MIVLDTSGLLAAIDSSQRLHAEAAAALAAASPPLALSPFVLAELDYLLAKFVGPPAGDALLAEVERGAYRLEPFGKEDIARARTVARRYAGVGIGLADASVVVITARYRIHDVLTLDERHFRAIAGHDGDRFRLLPADWQPAPA